MIVQQQVKNRAPMMFICVGIISLALSSYQDYELEQLDVWHHDETAQCEASHDYFLCAKISDNKFSDQYYPMLLRATVFQIAGISGLFLGFFAASWIRWQRRAKLRNAGS